MVIKKTKTANILTLPVHTELNLFSKWSDQALIIIESKPPLFMCLWLPVADLISFNTQVLAYRVAIQPSTSFYKSRSPPEARGRSDGTMIIKEAQNSFTEHFLSQLLASEIIFPTHKKLLCWTTAIKQKLLTFKTKVYAKWIIVDVKIHFKLISLSAYLWPVLSMFYV